ncbi:MAG: DUF6029 family protein [Bacteroidales bacterium]|nr:DUF6029 family protein [Bacteroidales bacterium]
MERKNIFSPVRLIIILLLFPLIAGAQDFLNKGKVSGNFQLDVQTYIEDSTIGAPAVPEKLLTNGFANVNYTLGSFSAGIRYEMYLNPILGYDQNYKGNGIPYWYANYIKDDFEITVGNFYEQFGNGLIFRTYEERNLGYDNAMNGVRVKYSPFNGVYIKGIIGTQRYYWEKGPGIVRGIDGEVFLNDIIKKMADKKTNISLGGSFVSKYQKDDPSSDFHLPLNVGAWAGRFNITRGKVSLLAEYASKINDPSGVNNMIYKGGDALLVTGSYSQKGLGIVLSAKRIDNMSFKSARNEIGNSLDINFLPPLSKVHTYSLPAIYPYATQPNGEMGLQGQVVYNVKKKSKLGGKYGMNISATYSIVYSIDKTMLNDSTPIGTEGTLGYDTKFFSIGDDKYFQDFNIEVTKKFNRKWKGIFTYMNLIYDIEVIEGHVGDATVYANIAIADINYKITPKKSLRLELQSLFTKQDDGDWFAALLEYSIAPKWFITAMDMYNYGNNDPDKRFHYYNFSVAFIKKTNRISLGYGKQREGILCVGGVCRAVPASNGFALTITSSF